MRVLCKNCKKFFFETNRTVIIDEYHCPRCKTVQTIKIVTPQSTEQELRHECLIQQSESSQNTD